mgnify:CR=1 FL=1
MIFSCRYLMIVVIKLANETSVPTILIHIVVLLLMPEFLEIVLLGVTTAVQRKYLRHDLN